MTTLPRLALFASFMLLPFTALAANDSPVSSDYVTILENRLGALEQQVQTLTNQVEQANYAARTTQDRLTKLEEDINTRFRMVESNAANAAAQAAPAPAANNTANNNVADLNRMTAPSAAVTSGTPSQAPVMPADANVAYDQAFSKVRDGDYEGAEVAMRAFLQRWPNNELSSNAAYWLGETFYVRGDFGGAAKAFAEAYQQYPKGAKSEDTLLKLGLSLSAMNRKSDACMTYGQLTSEFPHISATNRTRVEQERAQLGCAATQAAASDTPPRRSNTRTQH